MIHYGNACRCNGIILSLIKAVIVVLPSIFPVFLYIIDKLFIQGSLPLVVYLSIKRDFIKDLIKNSFKKSSNNIKNFLKILTVFII